MTTTLSIENGSLFKGESECEKFASSLKNTMAEQNVPTQPPTRTYEQIVPRSQWLTKSEKATFFQCSKDSEEPYLFIIIRWTTDNTNFFLAITASANADLLTKALTVTPVIPAYPFELPPSGNTVIDFVNELGYLEPVEIVSSIRVNYVYQPWRAILTLINQCLTGKTSGSDKPRHPRRKCSGESSHNLILIMQSFHHLEIILYIEISSVVQKISKWLLREYKENPSRKCKRATCNKACSTQKDHNHYSSQTITAKPTSAPTSKPSKHKLPQKVRKGKPTFQLVDEDDEAQQESVPQEEGYDPLTPNKPIIKSLEAHQEKGEYKAPVGGVTIRDPVSETTPKLPEVVGKGKAIVTEEQVAHSLIDSVKKKRKRSVYPLTGVIKLLMISTTGPSSQPEDDTSEKVIHESSSTSDSERTESETEAAAPKGDKDQGEVDSSTVTSGVSIPVSDPEKAHEALAGPDPEPMQEDQTGSNSGKLHLITDERVIDDNPESHSGSMSSMKNLDDTYNFGDQFLYDKPTEDDQEKSKVREESDSPTDPLRRADHSWLMFLLQLNPKFLRAVDKYLGTNLMMLLKVLNDTHQITIEKYSVLPARCLSLIQESKRVRRRNREPKRNKSALFSHMNKIKSANRNTANYHLYHALMEALIADEDAMDKEVADKVKDHKERESMD
ncbi:hypothetical protein Tco_0601213 [Tanacetum coccineum]